MAKLKNLAYALKLERAGAKPIIKSTLSRESMEEQEEIDKEVIEYLLRKQNVEKNTRLNMVFGPSYFLGYSTN